MAPQTCSSGVSKPKKSKKKEKKILSFTEDDEEDGDSTWKKNLTFISKWREFIYALTLDDGASLLLLLPECQLRKRKTPSRSWKYDNKNQFWPDICQCQCYQLVMNLLHTLSLLIGLLQHWIISMIWQPNLIHIWWWFVTWVELEILDKLRFL